MFEWGYETHNGPTVWPQNFPIAANGKRQSPIDIDTKHCTSDGHLKSLEIKYPLSLNDLSIVNSGHGWRVDIPPQSAQQTLLHGGPLNDDYRLAQFHCHWGRDCTIGSEHTVNGKSYAAEIHFVHWNAKHYATAGDAMPHENGLAVIGVFLEIGPHHNQELDKICKLIDSINYKGQSVGLKDISIDDLLPQNRCYWTYMGSLTTPPFYESVTWIVMTDPIQCSEQQIAKFRQLCFHENSLTSNGQLLENFRPPQSIGDRKVTLIQN